MSDIAWDRLQLARQVEREQALEARAMAAESALQVAREALREREDWIDPKRLKQVGEVVPAGGGTWRMDSTTPSRVAAFTGLAPEVSP